ncbi:hypothetical protein [Specibacter cremeus]|uniref:hypothetical protein n=1 Tax=Specibacter cremeus TaxID=1629051 RepID=UPI000F7AD4A2|nr:hypothetical protein [Specibacter cremeus]
MIDVVGLLHGAHVTDIEGEDESQVGYTSSRVGPSPEVSAASSFTDELDNLAAYLTRMRDEGVALATMGILVPVSNQARQVVSGLAERGVDARLVDSLEKPGMRAVLIMHRSKGMGFPRAVLFGLSENRLFVSGQLKYLAQAEKAMRCFGNDRCCRWRRPERGTGWRCRGVASRWRC